MKRVNNEAYPPEYWDTFYEKNKIGWDIGYVSTPLRKYFDQIKDNTLTILIPGAGNGYEVEYLYEKGFKNIFLLDYSKKAIKSFINRYPHFPENNIINENFFTHHGTYDLIIEQTFFSSIPKTMRNNYAKKTFELLKPDGKLVGLLFNHEFQSNNPPFGGSPEEYRKLFRQFHFKTFETAYNSIKPRRGREIFFILEKKVIT